jgi:hypothetical protein
MANLCHKSGRGKILSDDRIIVRLAGERLWMYGTPWHGEAKFACPARAPVTRIYFLRHGRKDEMVALREANSTARLLACSFLPFYDPAAMDFTLAFLEGVTKEVPCCELRFVPDQSVVDFVQPGTTGRGPWVNATAKDGQQCLV